ncbi:MAG: GTPase Era [Spirochaetales bacterium]|nr:GTPase Era [Spirochaetales bacterium]
MKSATVSLVGRPSSGKSSLVNALCGGKVSIVSPVPQTTRNRVRGILTEERGQLVFLDTPGFHLSEKKINLRLQGVVRESLGESDLSLYVVDVSRPEGEEERAVRALLAHHVARLVLALNKIDLAADRGAAALAAARSAFPGAGAAAVSALSGEGREALLAALFAAAPEGDLMYPPEYYTDQDPGFRIAELVREQVILRTAEEIPHAVYVEIADLEMREEGRELWARGFICVERESQKGIVIGRKGEKIRDIVSKAQAAANGLFPYRVTLDFRVKVRPRWRRDDLLLRKLIN